MANDSFSPLPDALYFTDAETDLLGRTADALSAWMGKPVLAQIIDAGETGYEWVVYALPLRPEQDPEDHAVVQVGGDGARIIGNRGGLPIADGDVFLCEYLWAIQLSDTPGLRYIKLDQEGDEAAWTNELREILPFDITEPTADDDEHATDRVDTADHRAGP